MIDPVTREQVPELCENKDCRKYNYCLLKFRQHSCEFYHDYTCFDCIFKQTDEIDGTVFCTEKKQNRIISNINGQGDCKICSKFRRLRHG